MGKFFHGLSVIPGVVTCAAVLFISRRLFSPRVALCLTLLFAFAHWPVRLSRYGWDVSFMVMAFSLTVALLLTALERRSGLLAYCSGVVAGIGLYSYAASRICAISLMVFLIVECLIEKERRVLRQTLAFMTGMIVVAVPLFCYYTSNSQSFSVRAAELSVFNRESPLLAILENLWRHALMFHVNGGYYSRDNIPGLTMMDPLTGLMFLGGVVLLCQTGWTTTPRLILSAFLLNFIPGVFSVSQEGAPYVYRVAAVMVPAFMIVGFGLQWLITPTFARTTKESWRAPLGALSLLALVFVVGLNIYQYFVLESGNVAAMRTMAYEQRLIGNEIARDSAAIFLVGRDILEKIETQSLPEETYAKKNPPMRLPLSISAFAVTAFSGRYDMKRSLEANLKEPKDLYFVEDISPFMGEIVQRERSKIIFSARNQELAQALQRHFPAMTLEHLRNLHGDPIVSVATFAKKG